MEADAAVTDTEPGGMQSWSALTGGLAETRCAFDRANQAAPEALKRALTDRGVVPEELADDK